MPLLRSVWSSGTISLVWGLAVRWEGLQNFCLLSAGHLEPDCHFAFLNVPRSKELESELGLGFWGRGGGCGNSTALIASDAVGAFTSFPNLPIELGLGRPEFWGRGGVAGSVGGGGGDGGGGFRRLANVDFHGSHRF
jgi:hypothetical protein